MIEYNRKATLEIFIFIPTDDVKGRPEATWIMTEGGMLKKQNLILGLWDMEYVNMEGLSEKSDTFYRVRFNDHLSLRDRVAEIAERYNGTHSRNTTPYHDSASFGILQKESLIDYLRQLKLDSAQVRE